MKLRWSCSSSEIVSIVVFFHFDTSLAASMALTHCLELCILCNTTLSAKPQMATGVQRRFDRVWKVVWKWVYIYSLCTSINVFKIRYLNKALLLWEKKKPEKNKGNGEEKEKKIMTQIVEMCVIANCPPSYDWL